MLIDGRGIADSATIDADICIVGTGAAGIAMAHELADCGLRICLLETGGKDPEPDLESLSEGENDGDDCVDLTSRQRSLGGATHLWGGNSAPFDEIDFESRDWVDATGWPIPESDLSFYYPSTQQLCQLGPCNYQTTFWDDYSEDFARRRVPLSGDDVRQKVFQRMTLRFGDFYQQKLSVPDSRLSVIHHSTCQKLQVSNDGCRVQSVEAATMDGNRFQVAAQRFVLAAGIENSRLLLLSTDVCSNGIGNQADNVGRYFMLHLNFPGGILRTTPEDRDLSLYGVPLDLGDKAKQTTRVFAGFQPSRNMQRDRRLLNYVAFAGPLTVMAPHYPFLLNMAGLDAATSPSLMHRAARAGLRRLRIDTPHWMSSRDSHPGLYGIRNWVEQAPRRANRLTLGQSRDAFGQPRIRARWSVGRQEKETIKQSHEILANAFHQSGLGVLDSALPPADAPWPSHLAHASHFMGETRMSRDPLDGVVNEDCQVHGVDNLFMAGGSVFPTGGATMATYNLVTLALRLSDHLQNTAA